MVDKPTTADCIEWVNNSHNVDCSFELEQSIKQSIRAQLIAAQEMAKALSDFYEQVKKDDGDPWSERPTQDLLKRDHPLTKALTAWREAGGE